MSDRDLTGYHTPAQQAHHHQHGRGPGPGGVGAGGRVAPRGRGRVRAYYIGGDPYYPPTKQ